MAQCLQQDDLDCWPKNSTEIPLEIDVIAGAGHWPSHGYLLRVSQIVTSFLHANQINP